MTQSHVILGLGDLGKHVAEYLKQRDDLDLTITGVTRSSTKIPGIEAKAGDALDLKSLTTAVEGADIIYHTIGVPYPKWHDFHPKAMANIIDAAAEVGAKVVFADNLYMYGEEAAKIGDIDEDSPQMPSDKKGKLRKKIANTLLQAHRDGKIEAVIGQASDFYGPDTINSLLEYFIFPNLIKEEPTSWFADLQTYHSWAYIKDFARDLVLLATDDAASGQRWIVTHQPVLTLEEFTRMFYDAAGVEIDPVVTTRPSWMLWLVSLFDAQVKEFRQMNYQRYNDWVANDSKFRNHFEVDHTPYETSIVETVDWYLDSTNFPRS